MPPAWSSGPEYAICLLSPSGDALLSCDDVSPFYHRIDAAVGADQVPLYRMPALSARPPATVREVQWSQCGEYIAYCLSAGDKWKFLVYRVREGGQLRWPELHFERDLGGTAPAVGLSADGSRVLVATVRNAVAFAEWVSVASGEVISTHRLGACREILDVTVAPCGDAAFVGTDRQMTLLPAPGADPIWLVKAPDAWRSPLSWRFSPDGQRLAVSTQRRVTEFDLAGETVADHRFTGRFVYNTAYFGSGARLVVFARERETGVGPGVVLDAADGALLHDGVVQLLAVRAGAFAVCEDGGAIDLGAPGRRWPVEVDDATVMLGASADGQWGLFRRGRTYELYASS